MFSLIRHSWRKLFREKQFSILNIAGLSTGIACSLLIFLWVSDEKNTDKFNEKDDRLYQVIKSWNGSDGRVEVSKNTPGMMASSMKSDLPEIEYAVSLASNAEKSLMGNGEKIIKAQPVYAGRDFFNVFTFRLAEGNTATALNELKGVLLSEKLAMSLFNTTKGIVGKTVDWQTGDEISGPYTVTGIYVTPENSSFEFDAIFSFEHYLNTFGRKYGLDRWDSNNPSTFLILKEGTDVKKFNEKIKDYSRKKMLAAFGPEILKWEGNMFVQKFSDTYLYNQYENAKIAGGRIAYVRLFTLIAIIILVIACINFMNLATAKSSSRIREAGIRKLVGANRASLILQYFGESTFMVFLSSCIALLIVYALLPQFRVITGKDVALAFSWQSFTALVCIILATGILAGSYPAIYLTSFKPWWVVKGVSHVSGGQTLFRKGLVVFQFTLSVVFIIAVVVVYRQMKLVQDKNLGFEKNNVISFSTEGRVRDEMPAFLAELRKVPGIVKASGMDGNFTGHHSGGGGIDWEGKTHGIEFAGDYVNTDWQETFSIPLVQGRFFRNEADSNAVLFNETAIRMMNLQDPVGKKVKMWGRECSIIGVIRDFHYESLYHRPGPYFVRYQSNNSNVVAKIDAHNVAATIERVKLAYEKFNSGVPFDYKFIDDDFKALYASEQRVSTLSKYFAALAIVISCLGLFGLAAFTAQKRSKEIGVRKVLGASVQHIVMMLSGNFLKLIIIALVISFPLAWWLMNQWLLDFQYRTTIGADIFIYASAATLLITICTISFQAIRASLANPVNSLRTE